MRNALILAGFVFVVAFCLGWSMAQEKQTAADAARPAAPSQFPTHGDANALWNDPRIPIQTRWILSVMMDIETVKPGMTRLDLLKVFTTEGGLSTRQHRTYAHKDCPFIKVDIDFEPAGTSDKFRESPNDQVLRMSRPYLQSSVSD